MHDRSWYEVLDMIIRTLPLTRPIQPVFCVRVSRCSCRQHIPNMTHCLIFSDDQCWIMGTLIDPYNVLTSLNKSRVNGFVVIIILICTANFIIVNRPLRPTSDRPAGGYGWFSTTSPTFERPTSLRGTSRGLWWIIIRVIYKIRVIRVTTHLCGRGRNITFLIKWPRWNLTIIYTFSAYPPHTSHALQPLDVACFKPAKSIWSNICLAFYQKHFVGTLGKVEFPPLLKVIIEHLKSKPALAVAWFQAAGICPFNRHAVAR